MLPIVQFDPATLSIWYDVELISSSDKSARIANAVSSVVLGADAEAIEEIKLIDDPKLWGRALQVVSAFHHEKRHWLDFVTTNYGAFRFRQFFDIYCNIAPVLKHAGSEGKLCCPLDVYADPTRLAILDVASAPPELVQLGQMLSHRRKMISKDRAVQNTRFGPISIGGEALLEASAYVSQIHYIQLHFGKKGNKEFRESVYNLDRLSEKYLAVIELAYKIGLVPAEQEGNFVRADTTLLEAMIFASLQSHHVPNTRGASVETSYPGERFAGLSLQLREDHPHLSEIAAGKLEFRECWDFVDKACQRVFGYSVADQVEADISYFEELYEKRIYKNVPEDVATVGKNYLSLRRSLLDVLRRQPQLLVSTELFAYSTAQKIEPNYVICASGGVLGEPPEGYRRLFGYDHPVKDAEKRPYMKWWWACSPDLTSKNMQDKRQSTNGTPIKFKDPRAWYSIAEWFSPISKLLMNGRQIRTMLGPELLFAEQRLQTLFKIKTEVYPSFEYPEEVIDPGVLYFYYGTDELRCDFTSEVVHKPNGKVLTPWTLRRWILLSNYAVEKMGGHDLAYFTFIKDWSCWVVSDQQYESIRALMRPPVPGDRILDVSMFETAGLPKEQPLTLFKRVRQLFKF